MSSWNLAYAKATGTSHVRSSKGCQDCCAATIYDTADGPVLLACVSDGAGTAEHSAQGADRVCKAFNESVAELLGSGASIAAATEAVIRDRWVEQIRAAVVELAAAEGLLARDFAATLLGAIVAEECSIFMQIGDGAIVISERAAPDEYGHVFWPQHGEYANTTSFITDVDAVQQIQLQILDRPIERIALFSDGLERLLLDLRNQTVAARTIDQLLSPLKGESTFEGINEKLAAWLDSADVNKRTDDDKSIVLGVRVRNARG